MICDDLAAYSYGLLRNAMLEVYRYWEGFVVGLVMSIVISFKKGSAYESPGSITTSVRPTSAFA